MALYTSPLVMVSPSRRTASSAASFSTLASSAPDRPGKSRATFNPQDQLIRFHVMVCVQQRWGFNKMQMISLVQALCFGCTTSVLLDTKLSLM